MDSIDERLLDLLAADSRMSLKALAGAVGMSSPSVAERVRRLEDNGVVKGFTIDVDASALGFTIQAIVRVRPLPGRSSVVQTVLEKTREVIECDKVTGDDCFIARVIARSIEDLDRIVDALANDAQTHTAIVKSQPVRRRVPA